ncbi:rhomboid family intramembrane serine protease [Roseivirga misakiensis]|uniref:Uncharacterized protein n=1 Tax=Roseivirga misakiensis TaxID=1563681 RepID=A0A1E5T5M0_9BACT|nr:rhomboid family intramembrane serine protease [Roseivirga misakiensis]OEK06671.1 hypothetical protein BFP71_03120 [Roseivirga misakiensis]
MINSILDDFKVSFRNGNILNQIIIINVVAFIFFGVFRLILDFSGNSELYSVIEGFFKLPSNLGKLVFRPWTIITHMFMHASIGHILWNMVFMYMFGRIITEYLGQNKLLSLYIWGGIGGGVTFILAYNLIPMFSNYVAAAQALGASAAVNAIIVGAATFQPEYQVRMLFIGLVKLKYIAAFFVVSSFLYTSGANAGGEFAHLGGAFLGYLNIKQLQQGNDWSKPVVGFVLWVKSLFKPQPKIKVSYRSEKTQKKQASRRKAAPKAKPSKEETSQAEIDAILDKISEKGYDALSKSEKQKLFNASKD